MTTRLYALLFTLAGVVCLVGVLMIGVLEEFTTLHAIEQGVLFICFVFLVLMGRLVLDAANREKPPVTLPQPATIRHHMFGEPWPGDEKKSATFSTLAELLAVDFVKRWSTEPNLPKRFSRYSYSPHGDEDLLMAEFFCGRTSLDKGHSWWVVGYMTKGAAEALGLPQIDMSRRDKK
jgi:hypothetical protein